MRVLFTALILLSCAAPVVAQNMPLSPHYEALWQEQQAANRLAQQRSVALENQIGALDAQIQTETRLRDLESRRRAPRIATSEDGKATPTTVLPTNIDAWMADSNARVRAAAANRR